MKTTHNDTKVRSHRMREFGGQHTIMCASVLSAKLAASPHNSFPLLALWHGAFRDWKFTITQEPRRRSGLSLPATTIPTIQPFVYAREVTPKAERYLWFRQESGFGDKRARMRANTRCQRNTCRHSLRFYSHSIYLFHWCRCAGLMNLRISAAAPTLGDLLISLCVLLIKVRLN